MDKHTGPVLSLRKQPHQRRSRQMMDDILEAAIRVLRRDGAHRFTTARVAEAAGASIGSVYQYFPNKEAILFRLQTEEWERNSRRAAAIFNDSGLDVEARLRRMIYSFFESEVEELNIRLALGDAAPVYGRTPEVKESREAGKAVIARFMREALPEAAPEEREIAADVIMTAVVAIGKLASESALSGNCVESYAEATADMACAYLGKLARGGVHG